MTCDWLLIIASCVCISFNLSKVPKNCLHYANAQKTAEQGHPREKIFPSLSIVTSPSRILYRITTNLAAVPHFHLSLCNREFQLGHYQTCRGARL
jgi:hypothetical protein